MAWVRAEREGSRRWRACLQPGGSARPSRDNWILGRAPIPRLQQLRFLAWPERSPSPGPWGDFSPQTSGTPKLERNTQPPFYAFLCHLPTFLPARSFSPPLCSPSLEGHKSGFRGKIWRRWELFSLENDCVGGILGKPLFNTSALRPPSLSVPLRGEESVDWTFGGHFAGCQSRRGEKDPVLVLVVGWTCTGRWKPRSTFPSGTFTDMYFLDF